MKKNYEIIYHIFELSIIGIGLPSAIREYKFDSKRRWRIDFAWPDPYRLAVEIEGGTWSDGRHTRGTGFIKDIEKYNALTLQGFSLLRFTPDQVEKGEALEVIELWFKNHR